jgi:hypothetical protein
MKMVHISRRKTWKYIKVAITYAGLFKINLFPLQGKSIACGKSKIATYFEYEGNLVVGDLN